MDLGANCGVGIASQVQAAVIHVHRQEQLNSEVP